MIDLLLMLGVSVALSAGSHFVSETGVHPAYAIGIYVAGIICGYNMH